jgi:hypothetical protein
MANTSAPLSETAIANFGATILDERPLTSLDDGTNYARFAAREFGYTRDELFRKHPWHFNREMALLAPNADAPAFRWQYSYTLPTGWLRLMLPRQNGDPNGGRIPYQLFKGKLYTDYGPSLPLIYGSRVTNAAEFDPLFARALGSRLAMMAAMKITGKQSYTERAAQIFASDWNDAIRVNDQEQGSHEFVDYNEEGGYANALSVRGQLM